MERNTYCMGVRFTKRYLDIDFIPSYIFSEHPHFTLIVQGIHNRPFGIVIAAKVHYHFHSLLRQEAQFNQTILVFLSVVTETYAEYFYFEIEIL